MYYFLCNEYILILVIKILTKSKEELGCLRSWKLLKVLSSLVQ